MGKTYWIRHHLRDAVVIDLLKTDIFAEFAARPALLRERHSHHKGLLALAEDGPVKKSLIVCLESEPRTLSNDIEIAPWENFVRRLWAGELF